MSSKPHSSSGSDQREAPQGSEKDDMEDEDLSKLPAHVQSVRDGLLDFDHFVGLQAAMLIAEETDEDVIPLSAYKTRRVWQHTHRMSMRMMYMNGTNYFEQVVTPSRADNKIWRATSALEPPKRPATIATPCLYFGFSVQEVDQRAVMGFRKDSSFSNYNREQLAKITTQGLRSSDAFKSREAKDVSFASPVSQVSAAASTALSTFESLAKFADEKHSGQHIPPVIAITSVRANTIVWLAYCYIVDDKIRDHKMISIWEGTVTRIWDAIQFCRIMDNLFFWAWHCLMPKVTQYLSQWRLRYCPDVPKIYSLLKMDTRTAEIVHQIQDHLSSLGLPPNEDLPALIRQVVVFQEVTRSTPISLPSPPGESTLEVALSSSTGPRQGSNPKVRPKGKEILHHFLAGKGEKGTAESSKPHNTHKPQLKSPPKHQTTFLVVPDKGKESTDENSTVLEDTKATSTNVLSDKQTFSFKIAHYFRDGRERQQ
ncbi:hypothetical protein BKA65DRAFT_571639 [Rhexocercosporidium sp. MPI-PUGE-AT-0058]|nr:hypothetical protein BKA65DRAFT_571639 [Rhexocercosporidium sp. MPI-PUGE-AT-0058]